MYFVGSSEEGVTVQVFRDGIPLSGERGSDVDTSGNVFIKEARLYKLIEQEQAGAHIIEIRVTKPGLQAFTFTFG